jgi:hypothetical protein
LTSLGKLIALAADELTTLALSGKLPARDVWTAIKGGRRYFAAIASGDVADDATQAARAAVCWACKSSTSRTTQAGTGVHCGIPFREGKDTCGCLTAIRIEGQTLPAGKTVVASERCPQSRW